QTGAANPAKARVGWLTGGADLSVSITDSPDPVKAYDVVAFTITVYNNGPDEATSVAVTIQPIPGQVVSPSLGCTTVGYPTPSTMLCALGSIASGADASVTYSLRPQVSSGQTFTTTADVSSVVSDPTATNNHAVEETKVSPRVADLTVRAT